MGLFHNKQAPPRIVKGAFEFNDAAYVGAGEKARKHGGYSGGTEGDGDYTGSCGCAGKFIGAGEFDTATVRDYANTLNSKAKEVIINDIIGTAKELKINIDGATLDEKIKSLQKELPSGDRIRAADDTHKKLCRAVAIAINKAHGSQIINPSLDADIICQQAAEVISSLTSGMHTEFLAVYDDVHTVIKNLEVLRDTLVKNQDRLDEKIKSSDDTRLYKDSVDVTSLNKEVLEEIERQLQLLQNLLHVHLAPTERQLAALIRSDKDLHGYINKIDIKIGSRGFGKVIADVLHGLGVTAEFAQVVDKALKKVGMTIDEYAKANSVAALRQKVLDNVPAGNDEALNDYFEAAELLFKNFHRSREIGEQLAKTGRWEDDEAEVDYNGGADEYEKSTIDKRVENKQKLRNLIFNAFYRQVNEHFDKFIKSLDALSMKVGDGVPLSEELNSFRHILTRINEGMIRHEKIYEALIGYYNDSLSKSKREEMLANFKMVASYIDALIAMPIYAGSRQYFEDIRGHITAIVDLVAKYSEEVAAKFGRGEPDASPYSGGSDDFEVAKIRYKLPKTIADAIRQFDYKYRVSQIKYNLARTSKELDHYGEKYDKLVAESIAEILRADAETYKLYRKYLDENYAVDPKTKLPNNTDYIGLEKDGDNKKQIDAARKFIDMQWDVKKRFWATVEAVDAYMRAFTDGIVKNPNDIRDIKGMLDDIDVINNWYSEKTGDRIASVFEQFPGIAKNLKTVDLKFPKDSLKTADYGSKHYYEVVKDSADATHFVGNPFIVVDPVRGTESYERAKSAMTGLGALKNFLSIFVHVGSKFGGEELRKKVFMTPTQMYNNIVDYVCASAYAQGFDCSNDHAGLTKVSYGNFNVGIVDATKESHTREMSIDEKIAARGKINNVGLLCENAEHAINSFYWRYGVWMRDCRAGTKDSTADALGGLNHTLRGAVGWGFNNEDQYFVYIMKSLAAKVLTVTGLYDVFDRPYEFNGINPIRMIVGGTQSTPKVEAGAVGLYLRLPLLAQFYRHIFGFSKGDEDPNNQFKDFPDWKASDINIKISMVPDMDGVFAGLIRLIFRKNKTLKSEDYSDEELKELISEINLVYQQMHSKYPQNTVMETIHEFVAEVNRRYGVITASERDKWETDLGYRYSSSSVAKERFAYEDRYRYDADYSPEPDQIAILPGEGEEEFERMSNAQKLVGQEINSLPTKKSRYTIHENHKKLLYNFRCAIDRYFENPKEDFSFDFAIKEAQNKLAHESDDLKRFHIVTSLLRGNELYSKLDGMKYVLFHETVISGLNILSGIHSMLSRFATRAQILDLDRWDKELWKLMLDGASGNSHKIDNTYIVGAIKRQLANDGIIEETDALANQLISNMIGEQENLKINGGDSTADDSGFEIKRKAGMTNATNKAYNRFGEIYILKENASGWETTIKIDGVTTPGADSVVILNGGSSDAAPTKDLTVLFGAANQTDLKELVKPSTSKYDKIKEYISRFLFNREYVMSEIIELLFGISGDLQSLVSVRIDNGRIILNYGDLKTLVDDLFSQVTYFLDLLRPHINVETLRTYTDKHVPGSYYWLQEQLNEKIFIGRPAGKVGDVERNGNKNLDEIMVGINKTFANLTRKWTVDGRGVADSAGDLVASDRKNISVATAETQYDNFDRVFAKMIFYDGMAANSGLAISNSTPSKVTTGSKSAIVHSVSNQAEVMDFMHNPYERLILQGPPGAQFLDTRFAARNPYLYNWNNDVTYNRSALFAFNQLIAKYIQAFYDPVSSKMYAGMLNYFANGSFSRSIADPLYTYPDTSPLVFHEGVPGVSVGMPPQNSLVDKINTTFENYDINVLVRAFGDYINNGFTKSASKRELLAKNSIMMRKIGALKFVVEDGSAATTGDVNVPDFFFAIAFYIILQRVDDDMTQNFNKDLSTDVIEILQKLSGKTNINDALTELIKKSNDDRKKELQHSWKYEIIKNLKAISKDDAAFQQTIRDTVKEFIGLRDKRIIDGWNLQNQSSTTSKMEERNRLLVARVVNTHRLPEEYVNLISLFVAKPRNNIGKKDIPRTKTITKLLANITKTTNENLNETKKVTVAEDSITDAELAYLIDFIKLIDLKYDGDTAKANDIIKDIIDNKPPYKNWGIDKSEGFIINSPQVESVDFSNTISAILDTFPNQSDPGNSPVVIDFNAQSLAYITAAINQTIRRTPSDKHLQNNLDEIRSIVRKPPKPYTPDMSKKSMYWVPYNSLVAADYSNPDAPRSLSERIPALLFVNSDRNDVVDGNSIFSGGLLGPTSQNAKKANANNRSNMLYFNRRADPDGDHVLFTSLSIIIRNIMSTRSANGQSPIYLHENVADVALYMKEKMRANIPVFKNLFKELMNRCELLKQIMVKMHVDLSRRYCNSADEPKGNPWPHTLLYPSSAKTSDQSKDRFIGILDSIINGSQTFINSCDQTIREIGDEPIMMETYQGSIKDYRAQNNSDPFMPISTSMTLLQNVRKDTAGNFLPVHSLGEDGFKLSYATRALFKNMKDDVPLEHAPGFVKLIESYNISSDKMATVDTKKAGEFFNSFVRGLRFLTDLKHYKGLVTPSTSLLIHPNLESLERLCVDGSFIRDNLVVDSYNRMDKDLAACDVEDDVSKITDTFRKDHLTYYCDPRSETRPLFLTNRSTVSICQHSAVENKLRHVAYSKPSFALVKSISEVLKLTESSFKDDKIKELIEYLTNEPSENKNQLEVLNIIDLNIVPINVHALMREIPLANLYNYSYTFDRLVIELYYGLGNANANKLIRELCNEKAAGKGINTAKDMLVAMMLDPYMSLVRLNDTEGNGFKGVDLFGKAMRGETGGELGRPKFLSDQLFNKALFGELYQTDNISENGPRTKPFGLENVAQIICAYLDQISIMGKSRFWLSGIKTNDPHNETAMKGLIGDAVRNLSNDPSMDMDNLYAFINAHDLSKSYIDGVTVDGTDGTLSKTVATGHTAMDYPLVKAVFAYTCLVVYTVVTHGISMRLNAKDMYHMINIMMLGLSHAWRAVQNSSSQYDPNEPVYGLGIRRTNVGTADDKIGLDAEARLRLLFQHIGLSGLNAGPVSYNYMFAEKKKRGAYTEKAASGNVVLPKKMATVLSNLANSRLLTFTTKINHAFDAKGDIILPTFSAIESLFDYDNSLRTASAIGLRYIKSHEYSGDDDTTPGAIIEPDNENVLNKDQIGNVEIGDAAVAGAIINARNNRVNTVFIRNLIFIVNLYRTLRLKLQRDLTYNKDVIARSTSITKSQLTEYRGNQVYNTPVHAAMFANRNNW